jgi:branched-chain amino acid transport system substrate-binding protein
MMTLRLGVLAVCTASFAFADAAQAIDPIKVGIVVAPTSAGNEWQAQQRRAGVEIALKMINDGKGSLGRPFELVFAERQGPPDKAGDAVEKLIGEDKVVAVIGGRESAAAFASLDVAHRHKVPFITDVRSHALAAKLYPEVFSLGISNNAAAVADADAMKALGAKRVVAFTENSDSGIERANLLGQQLNNAELGIQYAFETLDPGAKDFTSVLQRYKANPPDVIVQLMRPPAAYRLLDELHRQDLAPFGKTLLYDGASLIEDPAFWQNANEAASGMLVLGAYHPKMTLPDLGRRVAQAYTEKTGKEPGGPVLEAADDLFVIATAIESGGSSEPEAVTKALEKLNWTGTRGKITISAERDDYKYHQWLDVPSVTFQITAAKQPLADTTLVQEPGKPFDAARVAKPK